MKTRFEPEEEPTLAELLERSRRARDRYEEVRRQMVEMGARVAETQELVRRSAVEWRNRNVWPE